LTSTADEGFDLILAVEYCAKEGICREEHAAVARAVPGRVTVEV
jgi:hypothetical protein